MNARSSPTPPDDPSPLDRAREWLRSASRVVALTGAGISTDSGIPDFRGPQGVWTRDPKAERLSDIRYYVADPEVRRLAWQSRLAHPAWTAQPGRGHRALVDLEREGKLLAVVTQNIDGLHQKAGHRPEAVIEVHGTMLHVICLSCGWRSPMEPVAERLPQERHHLLRAVAEGGGARARDARRADLRPAARHRHDVACPSGGRPGADRARGGRAGGHPERRAHRDG
jgi:NAD-dependent SIR2 family protein deacetylase